MDKKAHTSREPSEPIDADALVGQLVQRQEKGAAAVGIVDGYPERTAVVDAIVAEARIYDIEVQAFSDPQKITSSGLSQDGSKGLLILVDAGRTQEWAEWLDMHREEFLSCARFVVVLALATEVAALLRQAPSFFSWIKGRGYRPRPQPSVISREEIAATLKRMTDHTKLTPEEFIASWNKGKIKDTFQNNYWLNLAQLWLASSEDDHEP